MEADEAVESAVWVVTATAADEEVSAAAAEAVEPEVEEEGAVSPDPDDVAAFEVADASPDEEVLACEEVSLACDEAVPACDALESAGFSAESESFAFPDEETVWDAGCGTEVDRGGITARATTDVQTRVAHMPTVIAEEMRFDARLPRESEGSSDEAVA